VEEEKRGKKNETCLFIKKIQSMNANYGSTETDIPDLKCSRIDDKSLKTRANLQCIFLLFVVCIGCLIGAMGAISNNTAALSQISPNPNAQFEHTTSLYFKRRHQQGIRKHWIIGDDSSNSTHRRSHRVDISQPIHNGNILGDNVIRFAICCIFESASDITSKKLHFAFLF
jgi:hypothetical protein